MDIEDTLVMEFPPTNVDETQGVEGDVPQPSTESMPFEQGVEHEFSHLDVADVMEPFVLDDRLVPWEYDEIQDNDASVLACAKFLEDDSFVTSKEF